MQTAIIKYQIGSYGGILNIMVNEDDLNNVVIAKAKVQLDREAGTDLPLGYVSFTIVNRIDEDRDS